MTIFNGTSGIGSQALTLPGSPKVTQSSSAANQLAAPITNSDPAVINDVSNGQSSAKEPGVTYHIKLSLASGGSIESDLSQDQLDYLMSHDSDEYSIILDSGKNYSLHDMLGHSCSTPESASEQSLLAVSSSNKHDDTATSSEIALKLLDDASKARDDNNQKGRADETGKADQTGSKADKPAAEPASSVTAASFEMQGSLDIVSADGVAELTISAS